MRPPVDPEHRNIVNYKGRRMTEKARKEREKNPMAVGGRNLAPSFIKTIMQVPSSGKTTPLLARNTLIGGSWKTLKMQRLLKLFVSARGKIF
jgi:hypothetical protein